MTEPHHNDELTQRYREASAQDTRRPGEHVRQAVRAHAQMMSAAGSQNAAKPDAPQAAAANRSRWKISVVAGVVLAGLTGLLLLQFDRGTPEEEELAFGRPSASSASSASTSPLPSLPPPSSPSSPSSPAPRETTATASPPAVPPRVTAKPALGPAPKPARPEADSNATHAGPSSRKAAPSPPAPAEPAPAPEARPAAPSARLADASAAPSEAPVAHSSSAGVPAPAPAPALRAAPAARAPAPEQKQERPALQAPRLRAEAGSAQDLTAALHEAARTGRVSEAERLLQQGAPLNAPDEAGRTPLILAVIHGHAAMVQRLMALGANPALVDQGGLTALQYARRLGRDRIASVIEAGS